MSVALATASYRSWVPAMGVPICTSLGRPKRPLNFGVELTEEVGALKPWGLFGKKLPPDDFTAAYRERLEKVGAAKLARIFHAISLKHGGNRLVLLCHECVELGHFCHRRVWADWWTEQTGQFVPELSWLTGADGLPVVVHELPWPVPNNTPAQAESPCTLLDSAAVGHSGHDGSK